MKDREKLYLPEIIDFEAVSKQSCRINKFKDCRFLEVDLSSTTSVHISFIGSLIVLKKNIEKNGGKLNLTLSKEMKKIFTYLKLNDFFSN